jgi:hypothetical protein
VSNALPAVKAPPSVEQLAQFIGVVRDLVCRELVTMVASSQRAAHPVMSEANFLPLFNAVLPSPRIGGVDRRAERTYIGVRSGHPARRDGE